MNKGRIIGVAVAVLALSLLAASPALAQGYGCYAPYGTYYSGSSSYLQGFQDGYAKGSYDGYANGIRRGYVNGIHEGYAKGAYSGYVKGIHEGYFGGVQRGYGRTYYQ